MKKTINDATKNLSKYASFQLKRAFAATGMPDTYDGILSRYLMIIAAKLEKYKKVKKHKTRKWQHEETGRLVNMPVGKNPGYRWYQVKEK